MRGGPRPAASTDVPATPVAILALKHKPLQAAARLKRRVVLTLCLASCLGSAVVAKSYCLIYVGKNTRYQSKCMLLSAVNAAAV